MEVGEFMIKRIFGMILVMFFLTSCSADNAVNDNKAPTTGITTENIQLQHTNFENIDLPEGYNIKQFEGMTLNFIVETSMPIFFPMKAKSFQELLELMLRLEH